MKHHEADSLTSAEENILLDIEHLIRSLPEIIGKALSEKLEKEWRNHIN